MIKKYFLSRELQILRPREIQKSSVKTLIIPHPGFLVYSNKIDII